MLSLLVLMVLVAVVFQIHVATTTDARIARNDVALSHMDLAIESALLEVEQTLLRSLEEGGSGGDMGFPGAMGGGGMGGGLPLGGMGAGGAGAEGEQPVDSRRDDWARPQRTEINGVNLRVLVVDESRKFNVLSLLTEDPGEAEKAYERLVRILRMAREGTDDPIPPGVADDMARAMRDHMLSRSRSFFPRAPLLTDDPQWPDRGLPLTLREFAAVPPFTAHHFREYRDSRGRVVHSLEAYLTVSSFMTTLEDRAQGGGPGGPGGGAGGGGGAAGGGPRAGGGSGAPGATGPSAAGQGGVPGGGGGQLGAGPTDSGLTDTTQARSGAGLLGGDAPPSWRINVNTAPPVVLKALFDDREVPPRFWDQVIEFRNEEDPTQRDPNADPVLDEFGEEVIVPKIFTNLEQLQEMDEWLRLEPIVQTEILGLLSLSSEVFQIHVTARWSTDRERSGGYFASREEFERHEEEGSFLTRTVRSTVWRRADQQPVKLVPLERWKVLDYVPFEVLDYPRDDR